MKIHYDQGPIVIDFESDCIAGKIIGQNLWVLPDCSARLNELKFTQDVMIHPKITHAGSGKLVMDGGPRGCEFDSLIMQFSDGSCVYLVKCDAHQHTVAVYGSLGRLDSIGGVALKAVYVPTNGTHPEIPPEIREVVRVLEADFVQKIGPDAVNFDHGIGMLRHDIIDQFRHDIIDHWAADDFSEADIALLKSMLVDPIN